MATINQIKKQTGQTLGFSNWVNCPALKNNPGHGIYVAGVVYAEPRAIFWYAVHKNMMFSLNCKIRQKNKYKIKVFVFGN